MNPGSADTDRRRSIGPSEDAVRSSIAGSASITILWRLLDRMLSLVSTPVLARLLTPEDFGLVAMASLAAGLVAVFLEFGVNSALIQQRNATAEHYDAAFTLRLIQTLSVGALVFAISWPASSYFDDERLVNVIQVVALTTAIAGFENIGLVLLQKHFEFRQEFKFFLLRRLLTLVITVSLALAMRNYWAMVVGALAAQITSVALSYALHPFRPRLSAARIGDILSFSQWVIVRGIGNYLSGALPSLFLGRKAGPADLGVYRAGAELSSLAAAEILAPLARVLYPALVEARATERSFRQAVTLALSVQFLLTMPASVGIALVSHEVVAVLLGPQWTAAANVLQVLALSGVFIVFHHTGGYALMAAGKVKIQAIMTWVEAAILAALAVALIDTFTPLRVAEVRLVASTAISWLFAYLLTRTPVGITWSQLASSLARPSLACIAMTLVLVSPIPWPHVAPIQALLMKVAVGVATYSTCIVTAWALSGRPEGAERYLLTKLFAAHASALARHSRRD